MKLKLSLLLLSTFFLSCARINQDSQDRYEEEFQMRHGIVPADIDSTVAADAATKMGPKLDPQSVARGKVLYQKNCLKCHGEKGLGNGALAHKQKQAPANLQNLAKEVSDFTFFMSISRYQGKMPGWKKPFNESENEDLVAYIKSFARDQDLK